MTKKLSISSWFTNHPLLIQFLYYYNDHPQFFYKDRIIDSVYDYYYYGIPLVWSGGRIPIHTTNQEFNMENILNSFSHFPSIKLRHVFTNCLLDDEALINDYRCNQFVKQYIRPQDEIIVNHPKLIKHLTTNYPNIPLIYSTTLNLTDIEQINELTKDNIYILNYNKNNDNEYLQQLKHKENIEILCGELCADNCIYRQQHYATISRKILEAQLDINKLQDMVCPSLGNNVPASIEETFQRKHAITNERMDELTSMGFQYFKIAGRNNPLIVWLDILLYYLALPEYRKHLKQMFLSKWL